MNDEGRLSPAPPTSPAKTVAHRRDGGLRLAVVAALEAFEAGDDGLAVAILLSALEDGPVECRHTCECGVSFAWPGELDHHQRFAHEAAA